jgi:hypothetical protein
MFLNILKEAWAQAFDFSLPTPSLRFRRSDVIIKQTKVERGDENETRANGH